MEINTNKENKSNYKSILQNIVHKPILVEFIFPYIKNEPFKFLHIIEKDQTLKESINSQFFNVKKNNLISKEINDNIKTIIFFKKYKEMFRQYKNKYNKYFNKYNYEKNITKDNSDPSFIVYKSKYILNEIKRDESLPDSMLESLIDISLNEQEKYEHIHLAFLPATNKNKYKDYLYIQKNLNNNNNLEKNNNCKNKEIDTLYCIIDDNEYYLNLNLIINKNIIINEIYFIYIEGIKDININDAVSKYLNALNKINIKQITFGHSFYSIEINKRIKIGVFEISKKSEEIPIMRMINDALINNKKYTFPKNISINFLIEELPIYYNSMKYFFGIYFLFPGQSIIFEINSKSYQINMLQKIENSDTNILVIKYNGLSSLDDNNYNEFVKKCLKLNIDKFIFILPKVQMIIKKKKMN